MDSNIRRPNQGGEPLGIESGDWRHQWNLDSRQGIVNKIMETLKRHVPVSGDEGLSELKNVAVRFEEKIYTAATSQSDYLRKISLKMLTMETQSKNSRRGSPLPFNSIMSSNKPLNSGSTGARDWRSPLQLQSCQQTINNMQLHPDQRLVKSDERMTDLEDCMYQWNYRESPEWLEKNSVGESSQVALQYNHQADNRSILSNQENVSGTNYLTTCISLKKEEGAEMSPLKPFEAVQYEKSEGRVDPKANEIKMLKSKEPSTTEGSAQVDICATVLGVRPKRVKGKSWLPNAKRVKSCSSSTSNEMFQHDRELGEMVAMLRMENQELKESFERYKEQQEREKEEMRRAQDEKERENEREKEATRQQMTSMQDMVTKLFRKINENVGSSK